MPLEIRFNGGLVTSRSREELAPNELTAATGIYYKRGDPLRSHKLLGRTQFSNTALTGSAKGLQLCQFDSGGTDLLVAPNGTIMERYTPGTTSAKSAFITGLNSSATHYSFAHAYNKWYWCNGYDRNGVILSNATYRNMGMFPPVVKPTGAFSTASTTTYRPNASADTGGYTAFTDKDKAYDATTPTTSTYSYATLNTAAGQARCTWSWATQAVSGTNTVTIIWAVVDPNVSWFDFGTGGTRSIGANITATIEYSTDNGSNWTTVGSLVSVTRVPNGYITSSNITTVGSNDLVNLEVRATLVYNSGTRPVTIRVFDIRYGSNYGGAFTPTTGMYYAFTEYDATNDLESPPCVASDLVTGTGNIVTISGFPQASGAQNTNSTHYRIYRTVDGGSVPQGLGLIGTVPIPAGSSTFTWIDDFSVYSKDTLPDTLIPLISVQVDEGFIRVYRDAPPPEMSTLNYYKGSLVGTSRTQPRTVYYSFAGRPESWPSIYVIDTIPLPEHDELVGTVTVGDTLLLLGKEVVMALDELPRIVQPIPNTTEIRPLRGMPGCVGPKAFCAFQVEGEPMAAWVSKHGVHVTNGLSSKTISGCIDWDATDGLGGPTGVTYSVGVKTLLYFDRQLQCLFLHVDSTAAGYNTTVYMIHMAPEHRREDGFPRWTGPHTYGGDFCTTGYVSGVYRRYVTFDSSDHIYLEWNGTTDASLSYNASGHIPISVTTGRLYGPYREFMVYKGNLRHTAFGAAQTASLVWTSGRDANYPSYGTTQTRTQSSMSLVEQLGTEFFVGLQGEWHSVAITHAGLSSGALLDIRCDVLPSGNVGRIG